MCKERYSFITIIIHKVIPQLIDIKTNGVRSINY